KLQPMVDGIDANRKKWEELCLSYQQTRRASECISSLEPGETESSQSSDSTYEPESSQSEATNQSEDSTHCVEPNQATVANYK
ncbi:hypothetical protein M9458_032958, partial [Cirrhinus mrigala]